MRIIPKISPDFWWYEIGQFISYMGDFCSTIALSWWILNMTGSVADVAYILSPAAIVKVVLLPILAPLSDHYARKKILIISDFARAIAVGGVAACVYFDYYHLILLIFLYCIINFFGALYLTTGSIITQIIPAEQKDSGMRYSQAMTSLGGITGGIFGGFMVAWFGIFVAFFTDACSFLIAVFFSRNITSNTIPDEKNTLETFNFQKWKKDLMVGAKILFQSKILTGMAFIALLINFFVASIWILFPLYIKTICLKDADYFGWMETGYAGGTLAAVGILGYITPLIKGFYLYFFSFILTGIILALIPFSCQTWWPITLMAFIGVFITCANIPYATKLNWAIPDEYRARVNSITTFMSAGVTPVGIAMAGYLSTIFPVTGLIVFYGLGISIVLLFMFLIPGIIPFMNADHHAASEIIQEHIHQTID